MLKRAELPAIWKKKTMEKPSKNKIQKSHILDSPSYMPFWRRHNHGDNGHISGSQELREGGRDRQSTEDFSDGETTLCDAVMVDTCHSALVQTQNGQPQE